MLGAMRGQVNESHGVGGVSRGWLAINLSLLALYRQVRRCRAFKWTEKFPAGALAMVDLDEVAGVCGGAQWPFGAVSLEAEKNLTAWKNQSPRQFTQLSRSDKQCSGSPTATVS
jgi:hypothetical protein